MGEFGENMPCGKALSELFAVERRAQKMLLEREVLPDRVEARQTDRLEFGFRLAEAAHASKDVPLWDASLTFARR
ncbi:hypothetical protein BN2475_710012 [Paraburkholderia ribeironis]|uniref:Uncharacterized protein n=1 Tax=Paraburkholderia ribeironis TaxID=1247936 RepID=A0A1N7SI04_9BURK|nr:hypothetical protein BN2475_710012 [Paraburkholderia ribeironis]